MENTVNKIAAGEVVERPASVVKELVENAIDAKSTQIDIEIEDAGLKLIKITDNGVGMARDDVELAFKKHTTSKINELEDLDSLSTLGFRGEALPSIASVSRVELITKSSVEDSGFKIFLEGGTVANSSETGCPDGTIIKINDLFYNVPARKKFLKKPRTEMAHITDWIMRFALAYPGIRFRLVKDGSEILSTPKTGKLFDTIASIFGSSFAKELISIEHSTENFSVFGFIGKPLLSHRDHSYQFNFINGRYVSSQMISRALTEAYHTLVMKHKYPTAILNFTIDPAKLDVNIHPTKIQVRFEEEKKIYPALVTAIRDVLDRTDLVPELTLRSAQAEHEEGEEKERQMVITPIEEDLAVGSVDIGIVETAKSAPEFIQEEIIKTNLSDLSEQEFILDKRLEVLSNIKPLAQLHDSYILVQTEQGLVIVDQHALHERVMYEKLSTMYATEPSITQELISPVSFEYNSRDFEILMSYSSTLSDLGFEFEPFGKNTILVRAVPTVFGRMEDREVINDILDDLLALGRVRGEDLQREKFIQILACKSAIKAGQRLNMHEIVQLLKTIPDLSSPFNCAHGRPTILSMPLKELEKQFKRIV